MNASNANWFICRAKAALHALARMLGARVIGLFGPDGGWRSEIAFDLLLLLKDV